MIIKWFIKRMTRTYELIGSHSCVCISSIRQCYHWISNGESFLFVLQGSYPGQGSVLENWNISWCTGRKDFSSWLKRNLWGSERKALENQKPYWFHQAHNSLISPYSHGSWKGSMMVLVEAIGIGNVVGAGECGHRRESKVNLRACLWNESRYMI